MLAKIKKLELSSIADEGIHSYIYFEKLLQEQRKGRFVVRQEVFSREDGILQQPFAFQATRFWHNGRNPFLIL